MNKSSNLKPAKYLLILFSICLFSCKSGKINPFKPASPHEQYQRKLSSAGLDKTAMGNNWINTANLSLQKSLTITLPFKESGYFAAEKVTATTYRFAVTRGQKISISLSKKPIEQFMLYADVWEEQPDGAPKHLAAADTLGNPIQLDAGADGYYLIRLQPELLRSGSYDLEISNSPSLAFPVQNGGANNIQSYFGDGRDANSRKHEGIDIFAPKRTPVLAIAEGTVTRVNQNNLGGNVVWMRPKGKDYTLYYAHLDQQIATEGQQVNIGDTLGLMGNTGNARTTAPHLHFGIYTSGGAIDPLAFVKPVSKKALVIASSLSKLNTTARTTQKTTLYKSTALNSKEGFALKPGTVMLVHAANSNLYTVELPDGDTGFIPARFTATTEKPLRNYTIKANTQIVFNQPDSLAVVQSRLTAGTTVGILGDFNNYHLIISDDQQTGWIKIN